MVIFKKLLPKEVSNDFRFLHKRCRQKCYKVGNLETNSRKRKCLSDSQGDLNFSPGRDKTPAGLPGAIRFLFGVPYQKCLLPCPIGQVYSQTMHANAKYKQGVHSGNCRESYFAMVHARLGKSNNYNCRCPNLQNIQTFGGLHNNCFNMFPLSFISLPYRIRIITPFQD